MLAIKWVKSKQLKSNTMEKRDGIVIFKNDKKQKETHPDYTGKVTLNGKELSVSLWIKESAKGKYMSGTVQEFQKKVESVNDDIPF